jgi:hypothetical protein
MAVYFFFAVGFRMQIDDVYGQELSLATRTYLRDLNRLSTDEMLSLDFWIEVLDQRTAQLVSLIARQQVTNLSQMISRWSYDVMVGPLHTNVIVS